MAVTERVELRGGPLDGREIEIAAGSDEFRVRLDPPRPDGFVAGEGYPLYLVRGRLVRYVRSVRDVFYYVDEPTASDPSTSEN